MALRCVFFLTTSHLLLLSVAESFPSGPSLPPNCPLAPAVPSSTLKVLVPNRTEFREFVDCSDPNVVLGFSVDVFRAALSMLTPRNVTYVCFDLGSAESSDKPTYDDMVNCLSEGSFDAVVGDVTIASNRLQIASFTQPYSDSGIVLLAPMVGLHSTFPGLFFAPFTASMWGTILAAAVATGVVLWWLEQNERPEKHRFQQTLWYFVSLLLLLKKIETLKNPLAKVVIVGWIAYMLILGSAYIAALSAILTVHKLAPDNLTISNVQKESTWGVGYQKGSIVRDYLNKTVRIPDERLLVVGSAEDYALALSNGPYIRNNGVAVIVEEIPYVNLFLARLPAANCTYSIVVPKLTSEGFGFAFRKGSITLSREFSMAILNLSESGELQRLQTGAQIIDFQCPLQIQSTQLDLISSQGLFLLLALALLFCIVLVVAKWAPQCLRSVNSARKPVRKVYYNSDLDFERSFYQRDGSSSASSSTLALTRVERANSGSSQLECRMNSNDN